MEIGIDANDCWLADESPVEEVEVQEDSDAVTITVFVHRTEGSEGPDCRSYQFERVSLDRPLGDRTLLVGGGREPFEAEIHPNAPPETDGLPTAPDRM